MFIYLSKKVTLTCAGSNFFHQDHESSSSSRLRQPSQTKSCTLQISIPNNVVLKNVAWCRSEGFIACGGEDGLLKVLKLETNVYKPGSDTNKGLGAQTNLSVNQNLEGHSGSVQVIVWNEVYQKLTTSDQYGLIIVWMMYRGSWYEEMINNRNKSVVTDMAWSCDGSRICIVYEDGVVIVGSVDGNRLWGKEIKNPLVAVEWSPNCNMLLFGFDDGEVHAFDSDGNFETKVPVNCLERGMSNHDLVGIQWFCYKWTRPLTPSGEIDHDANPLPPLPANPNVPHLAVIYRFGTIQFMKNETDPGGITAEIENIRIVNGQWNNKGDILALSGILTDMPNGEQNVVKLLSPFGEQLRTLKVPGNEISGCGWDAQGLRLCLAVDSHVFFANIRPDYKWGYCGETIVYSYQKHDRPETYVAFWDVKLEEVFVKHVKELIGIASKGDFCTLVSKADDPSGTYYLQLCNCIGTPVDFKYTDIEPCHIVMSSNEVVIASKDAFYIWQFTVPRKAQRKMGTSSKNNAPKEALFHVDDIISDGSTSTSDIKKKMTVILEQKTNDPISCMCANQKSFIIWGRIDLKGRESGTLQKYALPNGNLLQRYTIAPKPERLALNNGANRIAVINTQSIMTMYDLDGNVARIVPNYERKDVWDMLWSEDNDEMIAIMEKTRLFILKNTEPQLTSSGGLDVVGGLDGGSDLVEPETNDQAKPNRYSFRRQLQNAWYLAQFRCSSGENESETFSLAGQKWFIFRIRIIRRPLCPRTWRGLFYSAKSYDHPTRF